MGGLAGPGAGEEEVVVVQREAVSCSDPAVREQLLARKGEGRRVAAGEDAPWLLGSGNGGREPVRGGRAPPLSPSFPGAQQRA